MKSFDEVFEDKTKYGTKIKTDEYKEKGAHLIIDQGQEQVAGYTDLEEGIFNDVPAIVFGDHTRVIKYIDKPFFLGADGVKVLKCRLPNANYKYLYYALRYAKIPNTGYNRHFKWLKDIKIAYPDDKKQVTIVEILDKVSTIIGIQKQKLQKLDELVKSRFIELFGDPIKNTQHRPTTAFVNVVTMQRGFDLPVQDRDQSGNIPVFGSNGVLDYHSQAKVCNGGVITGRSGTIGKVFYTKGAYWPLNTTLFSVDTHHNNIIYLAHLLMMFDLARFTEGTGVPTLNRNKFHSVPIIDVPIDEQNEFAKFVEEIDKLKFAVQQALDKAQLLFDSLMQKYFG